MQSIKVILVLGLNHFESWTIWTSKVPSSHLFIIIFKEIRIDSSHNHESKRGVTFEDKNKIYISKKHSSRYAQKIEQNNRSEI